jgi:mercuric ion transport protein
MNPSVFTTDNPSPLKSGRLSLRIAGVSAILASICYLGPFLLIAYGLNSSRVLLVITLSEWSRPILIVLALIALCFAYEQIWHPKSTFNPGQNCVTPQIKRAYKAYFLFIALLVVNVLMIPYFISNIS